MIKTICRGKSIYTEEWITGYYIGNGNFVERMDEYRSVDDETVGRFTGLLDINNKSIFEDDIIQYKNYEGFDCCSVVKFGEYKQDGSGGEYDGRKCIGIYVEVISFTCPDWCENEPDNFPRHMLQQNVLEVASKCEIIGNIHDNPELLA